MRLIPKSLTTWLLWLLFQPYGRTPTRTADLIDVNDAARFLKGNHGKASSSTENERGAKRGANPSFLYPYGGNITTSYLLQ